MTSYNEAYNIIKRELSLLNIENEEVELLDSAGRVSLRDIYSNIELPSFDNSSMDGICFKYSEGVKSWNIIGEISAGNFYDPFVKAGEAILIMTGAKIPSACDTVIPVEDIEICSDNAILKTGTLLEPGQNIRRAAQDLKNGELILSAGLTIKPVNISLLASCGIERVRVHKKLTFGVLATGDELVDITENPVNDKLRASNLYALISHVESLGMKYSNYGIAKDNKEEIKQKIITAIANDVDIILTTGGVSVGKFDYMNDILKELDAEVLFWKVNIKPGRPLLFAKIKYKSKNILLFGFPGNPVSAIVNFTIFIKRAILETYYNLTLQNQKAVLLNDIRKSDNKMHFERGCIKYNPSNGLHEICTDDNQSSSNMAGLSRANALAVIEENSNDLKQGDIVECIMV